MKSLKKWSRVIVAFSMFICYSPLHSQPFDPSFAPQFTKAGFGFAIETQPDDKILVSGTFSLASTVAATKLVRLMKDGSFDPSFRYDKKISNIPFDIDIQKEGKILISGGFYNLSGQYLGAILRLLPNGQLDKSFRAKKDKEKTYFLIKTLPNQKVFTSYFRCDTTRTSNCFLYGIELLNEDGTNDPGFTPIEFEFRSSVADIAYQSDDALLVFGTKLNIENYTQTGFRLDATGKVDTSFNPIIPSTSNFTVSGISVLQNGSIGVLAGDKINMVVLDSVGKTIFNQAVQNDYAAIVASKNNTFFIIGEKLVQLFPTGEIQLQEIGVNFFVYGLASQSDGIVATGIFDESSGTFAAGISKYKHDAGMVHRDPSFQGALMSPGQVRSVAIQNDHQILVGGAFNFVNGQEINHLVRLNNDGSIDPAFNLSNTNRNSTVSRIEVLDDQSFITAGYYRRSGIGAKVNGLTLFEKDGNRSRRLPFPFSITIGSLVYMQKDSKGHIYAGDGAAVTLNGTTTQGLAKYEFTMPINFNLLSYVYTDYGPLYMNNLDRFNDLLTTSDDKLLLVGKEINYNGSGPSSIVRALENGPIDPSFMTSLPSDFEGRRSVILDDQTTLIMGIIGNISGPDTAVFLKLDIGGQIDPSFNVSIKKEESEIFHISQLYQLPNGYILVSGDFDTYNGSHVPSGNIIINKHGQFIEEFLPEIPNAVIYNIIKIDSSSFYLGGDFIASNGATSLLRFNICNNDLTTFGELRQDCGSLFCKPCSNCKYNFLQISSDKIDRSGLSFGNAKVIRSNACILYDGVAFNAKEAIFLSPQFKIEKGKSFIAQLKPCLKD